MGVGVGGGHEEVWQPPTADRRKTMQRELLSLRRLEAFRAPDLKKCDGLHALPVVVRAARQVHEEPWEALPGVIKDALEALSPNDINAQALQCAYGITFEGRTAKDRREQCLATLAEDARVNSPETLKSREIVGASNLLMYLIDKSQDLLSNPPDGAPYWKTRHEERGRFRPLAVVNKCRLGPDGQIFEAEWDGIYRICKDGVRWFSNPYGMPGSDGQLTIVSVEGGDFKGELSESTSQGEVRWGMRLHREMNTDDIVRLRWRANVTVPPGGRPLLPIFGQVTEVPFPWLLQEVHFHPDRVPRRVRKALGPLSGWPQRCGYDEQAELDPDLCARVTWKDLKPDECPGIYWEW